MALLKHAIKVSLASGKNRLYSNGEHYLFAAGGKYSAIFTMRSQGDCFPFPFPNGLGLLSREKTLT